MIERCFPGCSSQAVPVREDVSKDVETLVPVEMDRSFSDIDTKITVDSRDTGHGEKRFI